MLSSSCRIQLESFEGPLDLLIYLIRRDEIDIYDIPMAHVADQYLEYIRHAKELNLDVASEYLVMAATLTRMKSKSLLPMHRIDGEEEEDPGAELRRQLILYRTFREIAKELHRSEETWTDIYTSTGERDRWSVENTAVEPGQTSLLDLLRALDNLSEGEIEPPTQRFQRRLLTITECIQTLERTFHTGELVSFRSVVGQKPTRAKIVSYFITILELIRRGWISFHQAYPFSEIELKRTERWTVDSR
ncbi:MAG: segregation/condensation protein A [Candidatus Fermentibacteraceae bacterium]|nr:segregation/condensation protein A [Candidatus Fermentibacteraceae bacterium]